MNYMETNQTLGFTYPSISFFLLLTNMFINSFTQPAGSFIHREGAGMHQLNTQGEVQELNLKPQSASG